MLNTALSDFTSFFGARNFIHFLGTYHLCVVEYPVSFTHIFYASQ